MFAHLWRTCCAFLLFLITFSRLIASADSLPPSPIQALETVFPSPNCADDKPWSAYLEKLKSDTTKFDTTGSAIFSAFEELAEIYLQRGEHDCALTLLEQYKVWSLSIKDYNGAASAKYKTAAILMERGRTGQAIESLRKALKLPGLSAAMLGAIHANLQKCYRLRDNPGSALIHGRLASQFFRRCAAEGRKDCFGGLAGVLAENGAIQVERGNLREAKKLIDEALSLLKSAFPDETHPEFGPVLLRSGRLYHAQQEYDTALRIYQRALLSLVPGFAEKDYRMNPRIVPHAANPVVSAVLSAKAEAFKQLYLNNKRPQMLEHALNCYEAGYQVAFLLGQMPQHHRNSPAAMAADRAYDQNAIETALKLAQVSSNPALRKRAFAFAEYSRARAWAGSGATRYPAHSPPESIVSDTNQVEGLRIVPVSTLQTEFLGKEQALIQYVPGADKLFVFVLTQTRFEVLTLPLDFPLDEWVRQMRRDMENYAIEGADKTALCARYTAQAQRLYQKLIQPVEKAVSLPKRLCIIPAGTLAQLPFEALLNAAPETPCDFSQYPYLLRRYQISYGISAAIQYELSRPSRRTGSGYLGIGPVFDGRDGRPPLERNLSMLEAAHNFMSGRLMLRDDAGVANFRQKAGRYGILHIATYAQAFVGEEESSAFITLADGRGGYDSLYAADIRQNRLKADLALLNYFRAASVSGEGALPLAGAFFEAGAGSVLPFFWHTDHTEKLALQFLKGIQEEKLKDEALWEAKIQALAINDPEQAHPVYWAGAVLIGDAGIFEEGGVPPCWLWGSGAIVALASLGYYLFRRKRRKP